MVAAHRWSFLLVPLMAASILTAADSPPTSSSSTASDTPSAQTEDSAQQEQAQARVAAALADHPQLKHDDGWKWGPYPIIDALGDRILLETEIGTVRAGTDLVTDEGGEAHATLGTLIGHSVAADLTDQDLTYDRAAMSGLRLRGPKLLVLPEGVFRQQDVTPPDREADIDRLTTALREAVAAAQDSALDDHGVKVVREALLLADQQDHGQATDDLEPSFIRRLIRHGWLHKILGSDSSQADAVVEAVRAAERFAPTLRFSGPGEAHVSRMVDAFHNHVWILQTDQRTAYAQPPMQPMYHWPARDTLPRTLLTVELPPGTDPLQPDADLSGTAAVHLTTNGETLASWKRQEGFQADQQLWREVVPATHPRLDEHIISDYMPPHLVRTRPNGDILGIFVDGGQLRPPADHTSAEADRFMNDAARLLDSGAKLDLIGQYLLFYVYDSPDPTRPYLIGQRSSTGDIHQTAYETLGTVAGGQFRGDCDDLSEMVHHVLEKQSALPHVISLPAHAACAWAEKDAEGWHVYLLQTGAALEFVEPTIQEALAACYKRFDESDTFDPNAVGLLLRFSGENTRSAWRLSHRIFTDREYAETMIDVQKDWHFQTYQRAIHKMQHLIEAGDTDNANYRELSGLYTFTGQEELSAEFHRKATDLTAEEDAKLFMDVEYVGLLVSAEEYDEAAEVVRRLLDESIPALEDQLGPALGQVGLQLFSAINGKEIFQPEIERLLTEVIHPHLQDHIDTLFNWVETRFNADMWSGHAQLMRLRRMVRWYTTAGVSAINTLGVDQVPGNPALVMLLENVRRWMHLIAPIERDDDGDALIQYSTLAGFYSAMLGRERVNEDIAEAAWPDPETPLPGHDHRIGGTPQYVMDLPWIKLSVPYWAGQIAYEMRRDAEAPEPAHMRHLGEQLAIAHERARNRGLTDTFIDKRVLLSRLIVAMATEDADVVREILRTTRLRDDKRLRDDVAMTMGDIAGKLSLDWYAQILQLWREELDYKPKIYWMAWRAALNEAPQHALMVAKFAAERYADDPAFVEEYEFMQALYDPDGDGTVQADDAEAAEQSDDVVHDLEGPR